MLTEAQYRKTEEDRHIKGWYQGGLDKYDQAMGVAKSNELLLSFHAGNRDLAVSHALLLENPVVVSATRTLRPVTA